MNKDHGGWRHLNASLEEKVEILSKNPYRFYIYPNVWTFRGEARIKLLEDFLREAERLERYELCARILEVHAQLTLFPQAWEGQPPSPGRLSWPEVLAAAKSHAAHLASSQPQPSKT